PTVPAAMPAGFVRTTVRGLIPSGGAFAVVLESDAGKLLPIFIGPNEADAIQRRLIHDQPVRPLTHDLLESVLAGLGATVERVEVDDLKDGVYYGKLTLRDARGTHRIDGR